VGSDGNGRVPHGFLQQAEIGTRPTRWRRICVAREPRGEAIAGAPGGRPSSRVFSAGTKRCGIGTERRPASDFGVALDQSASDLGDRAANPNAPGSEIDIFDIQSGELAKP